MQDELSIRGSLEESSFPELLRSVCKSKESGILTCHLQDSRKSIFIDQGQVIFASSTLLDDRFGESLLRQGKITVRNFLDATKLVRAGRRLGGILCEQNALTPEELVEGVRNQVRDIILNLFSVTRGSYDLVLKDVNTQEMILLNSSTEDLLFQGAKTIDSWSRISKGIGSFNGRPVLTVDAERVILNISLNSEESHIYSLCEKGRFTVEEICGMSYLSNFETCRVLWGLMLAGALDVQETIGEKLIEEASPSSADAESDLHDLVESYNDVFSFIYDYVHNRMGEKADHLAERAILQVQGVMPNLTRGLRLNTYGRVDFDTILQNLSPIPESGRMDLVAGAMEEIVYALLGEVATVIGSSESRNLSQEIHRMRKN